MCHPEDINSSWWHISPMKLSASHWVKLVKKFNWIQSTSAHGIESLCRHSKNHIPTVLQGNLRNCCYQSTVSHPSEGIWQHLWGTNIWRRTLYCFQKQSRFSYRITTIFTAVKANSYVGLRFPDLLCVGGYTTCVYLASIFSSCLKSYSRGEKRFPLLTRHKC